jgi:hypothetical protein
VLEGDGNDKQNMKLSTREVERDRAERDRADIEGKGWVK